MENRDELLQEEMPQASLVENPQKPKKSRRKTVVILGAAAAVVLAAVIVLLTRESAASVTKRYCTALWGDFGQVVDLSAFDWKTQAWQGGYSRVYEDEEAFFEAEGDKYDADIQSWQDYYKARGKYEQEQLEDSIGTYSVEVDVTKTRKFTVDKMRSELSDRIDDLEGNGSFDADEITAAKKVTAEIKIKGEDEVIRHTYKVYLVKISGAWKVLFYEEVG